EFAIALLGVELPGFLAVEIEAGKVARAGEGVDMLAVRAGRGRGQVAFIAHITGLAGRQLALPTFLAVGADAREHDIIAVLAGKEDGLVRDSRCGAARAGPLQTAAHVLRSAPRRREISLARFG